jgi:hypothetical protein
MEPRVPEQIEVAPIPDEERYVEYSTFPAPTYVEYVPYTSANDEVYREVAPQQVSYLYVSVSVILSKTVTSVHAKGKERVGLYFVDYFIYSLLSALSPPASHYYHPLHLSSFSQHQSLLLFFYHRLRSVEL